MPQVFVSYSRKDKDFVRKLADAFASQNRNAWIDWKDIPLTAEWQKEILTNIEAAENLVFVISPDSVASLNCKREIGHALAYNKRILPIFFRPVADDAIPEDLGKFQRIEFSVADNFDEKFAALAAALDTDLQWVQRHTRLADPLQRVGPPRKRQQLPPSRQRSPRSRRVEGHREERTGVDNIANAIHSGHRWGK